MVFGTSLQRGYNEIFSLGSKIASKTMGIDNNGRGESYFPFFLKKKGGRYLPSVQFVVVVVPGISGVRKKHNFKQ